MWGCVPLSATLPAHGSLPLGSGRRRFGIDGWTLVAAAIGLFVAIPVGTVLVTALGPSDGMWSHLVSTVLWEYIGNTLWLMLGVGAGTIVIGTSTAWLVTMYRFPGRRVLSWALLLPLAVPSYILAFVITDQLEYAGNVQSALRGVFGWTSARDYWFPEIRSLGGRHRAVVVLTPTCISRAGRFHESASDCSRRAAPSDAAPSQASSPSRRHLRVRPSRSGWRSR